MSFGPSTYIANNTYVLIESGWFWLGDTYVDIYWNGTSVYYGVAYLYNPYRSFQDGDAFPGSDGNNYAIGDHQFTQSYSYSYTSGGASSSYVGNYEYYGVKQEVVPQVVTPDTDVTTTWPSSNLAYDATSFTVGIANGSSDTTYRVVRSSTVLGSRKGNGNIVVTGEMPPIGDQLSYELDALVTVADGGDATPETIEYQSVRKDAQITEVDESSSATYGLELFDASGNKTLTIGDTVAFISASTTVTISNSSSSGTLNLPLSGIRTVITTPLTLPLEESFSTVSASVSGELACTTSKSHPRLAREEPRPSKSWDTNGSDIAWVLGGIRQATASATPVAKRRAF